MSDRSPEEREAARQERLRRRGAGGEEPPSQAQPPVPPNPERPIGTIPPRGAAPPPAGPSPRRRSPGRHALLAGLVAAVAAAIVFLVVAVFEPFKGDGGEELRIRVPAGLGAGGVGDLLAERGVVSSGLLFEIRATLEGKRGDLRSGTYVLREGMGNGAALAVLTDTGNAAPVISVVVPEGPSRREVAPVVAEQGVRGAT